MSAPAHRTLTAGQRVAMLVVYMAVAVIAARLLSHLGSGGWWPIVASGIVGLMAEIMLGRWFVHCNRRQDAEVKS